VRVAALLAVLTLASATAHAGVTDFLFDSKKTPAEPAQVDPHRRTWRIGEFTAMRLVPREAGSSANQQPANLHPEGLRQQLALVRTAVKGTPQPLFANDELAGLVEPLLQALSVAGPGDDVLLLSTARRGDGVMVAPLGITARLHRHVQRPAVRVRRARSRERRGRAKRRCAEPSQRLARRAGGCCGHTGDGTAGCAGPVSAATVGRGACCRRRASFARHCARHCPCRCACHGPRAERQRRPAARCRVLRGAGATPQGPEAAARLGRHHRRRIPAEAQGDPLRAVIR